MKNLHPGWEWRFFSDADCNAFISKEMPVYEEFYHAYKRPVMRADCFRLLAVYHLGGFYLDTDFLLAYPLDPLCIHKAVFPWEQTIRAKRFQKRFPEWQRTVEKPRIMGNYAFGSEAGHPFLKALIDELVVRTECFEAEDCSDHDVMFATGPDAVTSVYYRDQQRWSDVVTLSSPRSGLGRFGDHHVSGSWWQKGRGELP